MVVFHTIHIVLLLLLEQASGLRFFGVQLVFITDDKNQNIILKSYERWSCICKKIPLMKTKICNENTILGNTRSIGNSLSCFLSTGRFAEIDRANPNEMLSTVLYTEEHSSLEYLRESD